MSCGRSRNAAPSMYSESWPRLYVTTALARFAGFVSMVVFAPGWRTKRSGRNGRAGGAGRTAAGQPQPARTATRATGAAKRTFGSVPTEENAVLAGPALHGIGGLGHDDVVGELVVPGLLLAIPEHPEVAEETRDRGDVPADPADERAPVADRAAGSEVHHADAHRLLPDCLPGRTALEVGQVGDGEQDLDDVAEGPADRVEDPGDDADQDPVDERGDEPAAEARAGTGGPTGGRLVGRLLIRGVGHGLSLGSDEREPVQLEEPARREDDRDRRPRQREPRRTEHEQAGGDEHEQDAERIGGERIAEVEAHGRLDARREAAERARQARQRAERTVEARVPGKRREREAGCQHRRPGEPQLAGVEEHRRPPSHEAAA